jgi:hypothetical protein
MMPKRTSAAKTKIEETEKEKKEESSFNTEKLN